MSSSHYMNRVGEKDNVQTFSLSRGAWGFWMKMKYFQYKLVFFKEKYGKISDCWTFSYSKTVSSDLESRLDLSALCVQGQRNGQRIFFTF